VYKFNKTLTIIMSQINFYRKSCHLLF